MRAAGRAAVLVSVLASCASTDPAVHLEGAAPITAAAILPVESPQDADRPAVTLDPTPGPGAFTLDPDKPPQPYDAYLVAVINDLRDYWAALFPELYGSPWTDPAGGVHAIYPGVRGVPGCGTPRTRFRDVVGNAMYCFEEDFIAFDDAELMPQLDADLGQVVVGVVLAHEWAHAVQRRSGFEATSIYMEQQADCFAGAWLAHVAADRSATLPYTDDELARAINGLVYVRDEPGTDATDAAAHGSAFDRIGAFRDGFVDGAGRCATYDTDPPEVMAFGYEDTGVITEDAPFDPSPGAPTPDDIVSLVGSELDAFFAERVPSMPALDITPVAGNASASCDAGEPQLVAVVCDGTGEVRFRADLARNVYDELGDFSIGYVLAAAWADAAQTALDSPLTGEPRVLAGDCIVGSFARSLLPATVNPERAPGSASLSPGDLDEAVLTAVRLGDDAPGTDVRGWPFEKIDALRTGVLQDFDGCRDRFGF